MLTDRECLASQDVEAAYNPNCYHNSAHAADVTQAVGAMIEMDDYASKMSDLDLLCLIIGACIHDVGHPGKHAGSCSAVQARLSPHTVWCARGSAVGRSQPCCWCEGGYEFADQPERSTQV